jgi:hypothetical protein
MIYLTISLKEVLIIFISNGNDGTINGATYNSNVPGESCGLSNVNGCDSVEILNLTINNSFSSSNLQSICAGNSITVGNNTYTTSGNYTDSLQAINGCDSVVLTSLIVDPIGCTDITAFNYDSSATCDDGSCIPLYYGCTDATAFNYNSTVNTDDGSCQYCDLTSELLVNQMTSPSSCDAWVFAYASSSYAPVSYLWSTGSTQNSITNLCSGVYELIITDSLGCSLNETVIITPIYGCTDSNVINYDPYATIDDGSCISSNCPSIAITGLFVSDIIDDRVVANFDNMNTYDANGAQLCRVDQIRIKYRQAGTASWSQKNIAAPTGYDATTGICNSTQKTDKTIYNLIPATEYEWQVKLWYCGAGATAWVVGPNFTTLGDCPNVGNLSAYGANPTKATFHWDDSNGGYEFTRIKMRVDSISNPQGSDWFNVGGAGISYPTFTKDKNNLTPGETYRGQARTWCDPNGGAYKSLSWTPLITWTQPASVRLEGGSAIANLVIFPNPSRELFSISFISEDVQNLRVRILNVIGEELINENLEQFIGEYTKQLNLTNNAKGIYFLEIETNDGLINKKLILQ